MCSAWKGHYGPDLVMQRAWNATAIQTQYADRTAALAHYGPPESLVGGKWAGPLSLRTGRHARNWKSGHKGVQRQYQCRAGISQPTVRRGGKSYRNKHERLSDERVSNWATTTPGRDATMVMRDAIALAQEAQGLADCSAGGKRSALHWLMNAPTTMTLRTDCGKPDHRGALSVLEAERRTQ